MTAVFGGGEKGFRGNYFHLNFTELNTKRPASYTVSNCPTTLTSVSRSGQKSEYGSGSRSSLNPDPSCFLTLPEINVNRIKISQLKDTIKGKIILWLLNILNLFLRH